MLTSETGKCGIAMEASYPTKKGANPPNPGPSPPTPAGPPSTVCDEYYSCSPGTTCCCLFEYSGYCFAWGCCPVESATCCEDGSSCCPPDYPVCDVHAGTCLLVSCYSPLFHYYFAFCFFGFEVVCVCVCVIWMLIILVHATEQRQPNWNKSFEKDTCYKYFEPRESIIIIIISAG